MVASPQLSWATRPWCGNILLWGNSWGRPCDAKNVSSKGCKNLTFHSSSHTSASIPMYHSTNIFTVVLGHTHVHKTWKEKVTIYSLWDFLCTILDLLPSTKEQCDVTFPPWMAISDTVVWYVKKKKKKKKKIKAIGLCQKKKKKSEFSNVFKKNKIIKKACSSWTVIKCKHNYKAT